MRALRRSSTATAAVAAADRVTASARTPPPVFSRRRRAGRRPPAVATDAPRGPHSQSAMHALRSSTSAAATVAAPGLATGGAQTPPPVFPCRRRAGRRPRAVAAAAPRGPPVQRAMHALRGSRSPAATVAATDRVTASARTLPPVFPKPSPRGPPPSSRRDRRPARNIRPERNARIAQLEHGGRHRRGRRPVTANARMPPPVFPRRRRAGRRPRTVATVAPRGTPSQGAMHALRGSTSATATVAAPALATAGARTPPPIFPRSRRDGPARYFGRAPAHRGTPGQVRRSRCARAPMAAATVAAPDFGTATPPTAFSILAAPSHRRAVYQIRAPGQVSHISTGPRASSVFHNQHRCGKRRAADALAM